MLTLTLGQDSGDDLGFFASVVAGIQQKVSRHVSGWLDQLWSALPDEFAMVPEPLLDVLANVNSWVPLDVGITALVGYYAFLVAFVVLKFLRNVVWPF